MWMLATTLLSLTLPTPFADQLAAPVRLEVDGEPIDSINDIGHSGPALHDLDGDGKLELLVGNFRGHIDVFSREESSTSPSWKSEGRLQAAGENFAVPNW